jgi:hypothetical protein
MDALPFHGILLGYFLGRKNVNKGFETAENWANFVVKCIFTAIIDVLVVFNGIFDQYINYYMILYYYDIA